MGVAREGRGRGRIVVTDRRNSHKFVPRRERPNYTNHPRLRNAGGSTRQKIEKPHKRGTCDERQRAKNAHAEHEVATRLV